MASSESGHVFISYRQQQPDKQFAHELAYDLQAAGHPVWIDVQGIEAGETWNTEIQKALDACYAYVVVMSPAAMESRWVRNELLYALREKSGRIYPVMLVNVKLPPELIAIQYVDFQGNYRKALATLLATLPTPPDSAGPPSGKQALRRPERPRRRLPTWLLGAAGLLVVALAVSIGLLSANPGGSVTPPASTSPAPATVAEQPTEEATPTTQATNTPSATLGGPDTPITFVFLAEPATSGFVLLESRAITDKLSEMTGLKVERQVETKLSKIVAEMCTGQIQMSTLTTLSYLFAKERSCAVVTAVALRSGSPIYASEIIAKSGTAKITDLKGKRFCRVDAESPSGWIMPKLLLKANDLDPDKDFQLVKDLGKQAQPEVVRAVYNDECDGGATFSDARLNLLGSLPDVMSKVKVMDTTLPIPNDAIAFAPDVPADMRDKITQALVEMSTQEDIKNVLLEINGWNGLQKADTTLFDRYEAFQLFFDSTGYKLEDFVD